VTYYTSSQLLVYICDDIPRTEYTGNTFQCGGVHRFCGLVQIHTDTCYTFKS